MKNPSIEIPCNVSHTRLCDLALLKRSINEWNEILPPVAQFAGSLDFLKRRTDFKSLIVDNLFVGIIYIPLSLPVIDPWAYCFGYLSSTDLSRLGIPETACNDGPHWSYYSNLQSLTHSLDPVASEHRTPKSKEVLILGPTSRNESIRAAIMGRGYNVIVTESDPESLSRDDLARFSRIFSSGYAFKIPRSLLQEAKCKIINLHASFLPWGRGIGTILFDSFFGHPSGYSIHEINEDIDTGDVLYRRILRADSVDTSRTYHRKVIEALNAFTIENIDLLLERDFIGTRQVSLHSGSIPYTSRYNFERLIRLLPNGYDTKLTTLSLLGGLVATNWRRLSQISEHMFAEHSAAVSRH